MFRDDLTPEDLQRAKDRMQWLLLAKFRVSGGVLNREAQSAFERLEAQYPAWHLAEDERDEFSIWTSDGEEDRIVRQAPHSPAELEAWLEKYPTTDDFRESDDWQEICAKKFRLAAVALIRLARKGVWPVGRWRQALQVWSNNEFAARSWKWFGRIVYDIPDLELKEIAHPIAWWLKAISKTVSGESAHFLGLIGKILDAYRNDAVEIDAEIISHAINHPVGLAIEAVINWWFAQGLEDDQGLHPEVKPIFDDICREDAPGLRYGPIILAGSLITLYRVDSEWTKENLLPYFDWVQAPDIAPGMWMSFLHSPRLYWPLLDELKDAFFAVPLHFEELGDVYRMNRPGFTGEDLVQ